MEGDNGYKIKMIYSTIEEKIEQAKMHGGNK